MTRTFCTIAVTLALAGCGQVAPLKPPPGRALPVKPLLETETPTVAELLELPPQAKPKRIDEILTRSQPRKADRFDLPPSDGGAAPTETDQTTSAPATTGPENVKEPK